MLETRYTIRKSCNQEGRQVRARTCDMKVLFHRKFLDYYTSDPAAAAGRLTPAVNELQKHYTLIEPEPATESDLLLVHTPRHLEDVRHDSSVYNMALLAAGASLTAASYAVAGDPAFALCRPPGHHASPDSCWGFCYFNNVAVALRKTLQHKDIEKAVIIDFDLHYGDGTANTFARQANVSFYHARGDSGSNVVKNVKDHLEKTDYDIIAVSAGFDRHIRDWGGMLTTSDYGELGLVIGEYARSRCDNRVFAVLEGGYNAQALADSIAAFIKGLQNLL
jgi:acetoin utilization deacetylase AcuC-like enzyme